MSLEDELNKLQDQFDRGQIDAQQFSDARARAIEAADSGGQSQSAAGVDKLDRDWRSERRQFEQRGGDGFRYAPTRAIAIAQTIFAVVFAIIWVKTALASHAPLLFVLAAPIMEILAIPLLIAAFRKAKRYEGAKNDYHAPRFRGRARR